MEATRQCALCDGTGKRKQYSFSIGAKYVSSRCNYCRGKGIIPLSASELLEMLIADVEKYVPLAILGVTAKGTAAEALRRLIKSARAKKKALQDLP